MADPVIRLHGDIGFDITVASVSAALQPLRGPISISLHSFGGDALAGIGIHNLLSRYPGRKTVIVEGVAASAASLIAMAGDRRIMPSNAFLMIHNCWGGASGDAGLLRSQADLLDRVTGSYVRAYASRTGKSENEIAALMAAETWFDAEGAVANGFATEAAEPVEIRACAVRPLAFTHMPDAARRFISITPALPASLEESSMSATTQNTPPAAASTLPQPHAASLSELRAIASASHGALTPQWVLDQATAGVTIEAARDAAFEELAKRTPPRGPTARIERDDHDDPRARLEAMGGALAARILGQAPQGPAERYKGWSVPEMARDLLEARGTNTRGWSPSRLIEGVSASGTMTTSDFPILLGGAANRVLLEAFTRAQSPILQLCRTRDAADFRQLATSRISNFPVLEEVPEAGPVPYGKLDESGEVYSVATYAKNLNLSRQAMVNDDLDAFGQATRGIAVAAAEAEARKLVALLTMAAGAGPILSDGKALFSADHGNLASTGGAISTATLSAGRRAIRVQKDLGDGGPIGVGPRYILTGPDGETDAERAVAALSPTMSEEANPFAGKLVPLVEPRLTGDAWWLFASPEEAPVLEIAHLNGQRAPVVETFTEPGYLGVTLRAVYDFGAGVIGWRGAWRNPGA